MAGRLIPCSDIGQVRIIHINIIGKVWYYTDYIDLLKNIINNKRCLKWLLKPLKQPRICKKGSS
jgi:hypothetical protein